MQASVKHSLTRGHRERLAATGSKGAKEGGRACEAAESIEKSRSGFKKTQAKIESGGGWAV
jgi:hypothetical protein